MKKSDLADGEIINQVLQGNPDAFEILMERYNSYIFNIVGKYVPRPQVREVAHDVFVRTYQSLGNFSGHGHFSNWLATIAVRCCYDFWRQHYKNREFTLSSVTEEHQKWLDEVLAGESVQAFEELVARRESREILDYALDRLSVEDRMVLTAIYLEGLPIREVAQLLGWKVTKVNVRAYRSKKKMRKIISDLLRLRKTEP